MAVRNPWVLPAAVVLMAAVLATAVFGGAAITLGFGPRQQASNILQVPGNYGSIQAAINAAKPGDTIQVAAGTYNENIMLDKPVSLIAGSFDQANADNNTVILDGGSGQATILVPLGLPQMPTIRGLVVRNGRDGIQAQSPFILENSYFYGSQMSVEYQTGSGGINRDNIYFNSANDAVHVDDMTMPLLIQGNRFMYAGDDAIEVDLPGSSAPPLPVEVDIWDNMLIGSSQDGVKFVDYATNPRDVNRRIVIAGNLIANNQRAGIGFMHSGNTNEDYSAADTAEAVRVYNDTFYGNDYGISGGDNVVAFNNIIVNSTARGAWKVQGGRGANSMLAYTLFFGNRVDTDQTLVGPGNIFGQDPLFVAAPGPGPDGAWGTVDDDFSGLLLRPGSPAIDKGIAQYRTASGELVPPTPLTGFTGAAPDLGWRELGSAVFLTPTPLAVVPVTGATPIVQPTVTPTSPPVATSTGKPGTTPTPGVPAPSNTPEAATSTPQVTATPLLFIQGIAPAMVKATSTVTLTIKGSGFQNGATVSFEGLHESPPQVTNVQVVDSTTMIVQINANDDSRDVDVWDVRVTNPDGATAILPNAFTVVP